MPPAPALDALAARIHRCRLCPRLVAHREAAAAHPPRRFRGETYWARPLAGFGDPAASIALVGLAPAAHGGNRTGRIFTGDESGRFLFRAMHHAGLASQPTSERLDDRLHLWGVFVTAAVRCAPPANRPSAEETARCLPYLVEEFANLAQLRVAVALGAFAWSGILAARRAAGEPLPSPAPRFAHGAEATLPSGLVALGSYHPSQQNTYTGRLTQPMLTDVLERAIRLAARG